MNHQEIFDRAVAGVMYQGRPSARADKAQAYGFACNYRGESGLRCAAGHLIAEEHYDSRFDRNNLSSQETTVWGAIRASLDLSPENADHLGSVAEMIRELQGAHDSRAGNVVRAINPSTFNLEIETWRDSFVRKARDIAYYFSLDSSIIDRTPWGEVSYEPKIYAEQGVETVG